MTRKKTRRTTNPTDQVVSDLVQQLGFHGTGERGVDRLDFHEVHVKVAEAVIRTALAIGAAKAGS